MNQLAELTEDIAEDKATKMVKYTNGDYCLSWLGEYDDEDNPVYKGKLYRAGDRSCGHRDCVRPKHWIKPQGK